jgi:hypothetical protein
LINKIIKDATVILLGVIVALIILLFGSYIFSIFKDSGISESEKPFLKKDNGWYELKDRFQGYDSFGNRTFPVETTKNGFRKSPGTLEPEKYNYLFLGDSFTYGVNGPWDETFVGMFSEYTKFRVLNGGVSSYSPTPYLHRYKKALNANLLSEKHKVIIALDISDVQDEAGYWIDGPLHPEKRIAELEFKKQQALNQIQDESFLRKKFPHVASVYSFVRYELIPKFLGHNSIKLDNPRSAFTYVEWGQLDENFPYENPEGYKPLGVAGGLNKVKAKLMEISKLANTNNGEVFILIYPWPSQLIHKDKFSFEQYVKDICTEIECSGVINTFSAFKNIKSNDPEWIKHYYLHGDIHFNKFGNKIIADELINFFTS